jgi:bifunctional non-homologous end joining protein LigD
MEIAGVEISHPDKIIFPSIDASKKDMLDYYDRIAERLLPHLKNRPLTLHRYPDGITESGFYQKKAQDYFPDYIDRIELEKEDGKITQVMVNDKKSLIYLVNQGTVGFHIWLSRKDKPKKPDRVIYDLDLPDDVENAFAKAKKTARVLREELSDRDPQLMTSGKNGLHVWYEQRRTKTFEEQKDEIKAIAEKLAEEHPDLITVETRKDKRGDRIFLDYMRNNYAQTGVCPYSLRPTDNAGVATPIGWDELNNVEAGNHYHIKNIFRRLGAKG